MDVSETNGFEVDLDSEAVLSCVVTTSGTDDSEKKHNTCFTSATLFLQRGKVLTIYLGWIKFPNYYILCIFIWKLFQHSNGLAQEIHKVREPL